MPPRQRQEEAPDERPAPRSARPASSVPETSVAARLRAPFPAGAVGKLPKLTCKDCTEAQGRVCAAHQRKRCDVCGNWISTAHMHLDYVGHAAVTDRLLSVDPAWSWEPAYRDVDAGVLAAACASGSPEIVRLVIENSPPLIEHGSRYSGMWVNLTVDGVTRLGYATEDRGGMDAPKILVSDGIRNAAMRFGVGLDLWSKEDLTGGDDTSSDVVPTSSRTRSGPTEPEVVAASRDWIAEAQKITDVQQLLDLGAQCNAAGEFVGRVRGALLARRAELQKGAAA